MIDSATLLAIPDTRPLLWLLLADWSRQQRPQAVLVSDGGNGGLSVS
jgi:hypothetical protein